MKEDPVEREIAAFVARYTPEIAAFVRAARVKLRAAFPRGFELVYDNYNALVFGFSRSERTSDALVSLAAYPRWVTLFFLKGAGLRDPRSLLKGSGSRVRSIRLASANDLDAPPVKALVAQAIAQEAAAFASAPPLATVVKSVSAKQRGRRAAPSPSRTSRSSRR